MFNASKTKIFLSFFQSFELKRHCTGKSLPWISILPKTTAIKHGKATSTDVSGDGGKTETFESADGLWRMVRLK